MSNNPIITRHIFPPIPIRDFDWCAYRADDEGSEDGLKYFYGKTGEPNGNVLSGMTVAHTARRRSCSPMPVQRRCTNETAGIFDLTKHWTLGWVSR
jgi:hypothetical protein